MVVCGAQTHLRHFTGFGDSRMYVSMYPVHVKLEYVIVHSMGDVCLMRYLILLTEAIGYNILYICSRYCYYYGFASGGTDTAAICN